MIRKRAVFEDGLVEIEEVAHHDIRRRSSLMGIFLSRLPAANARRAGTVRSYPPPNDRRWEFFARGRNTGDHGHAFLGVVLQDARDAFTPMEIPHVKQATRHDFPLGLIPVDDTIGETALHLFPAPSRWISLSGR
jgi:hypothetical protein